jgi:hypothetical protein
MNDPDDPRYPHDCYVCGNGLQDGRALFVVDIGWNPDEGPPEEATFHVHRECLVQALHPSYRDKFDPKTFLPR